MSAQLGGFMRPSFGQGFNGRSNQGLRPRCLHPGPTPPPQMDPAWSAFERMLDNSKPGMQEASREGVIVPQKNHRCEED